MKNWTEDEMDKGLFITFEGSDGCGKTTQSKLFAQYLRNRGFDVVQTREPGGTSVSEKIREIILDPGLKEITPKTEMFLFAAARAQHIEELIKPAVERGAIVVCDRFVDSSMAYQGYARGLGDQVRTVNGYAVDGCMPDITFFFDISPDRARLRNRAEGKADRLELEKEQFYMDVYEGFKKLSLIYPRRYAVIDAAGSVDEIQAKVIEVFDNKLKSINSDNKS